MSELRLSTLVCPLCRAEKSIGVAMLDHCGRACNCGYFRPRAGHNFDYENCGFQCTVCGQALKDGDSYCEAIRQFIKFKKEANEGVRDTSVNGICQLFRTALVEERDAINEEEKRCDQWAGLSKDDVFLRCFVA
jgi:hypothetical protein